MKMINISDIRIDGGTQSREAINNEAVQEYADAIRGGALFPPLTVFYDGADYWLADGFHRYHAHRAAERASVDADVREGTCRDAVLFSLGANTSHGLRRTNADKRKAVMTILRDAEWAAWSDRKIADICAVGAPLVGDVRRSICNPITDAPVVRTVERGGKTYQQDTTKIGKKGAKKKKDQKRSLDDRPDDVPELTADDHLAEAQDAIRELAEENDQLRDRLAVEAMDASEEEKTSAAETIRELRAKVKTLEAELAAVKVSRDTYMRESGEKTKQIAYWRKQAEKTGGVTA